MIAEPQMFTMMYHYVRAVADTDFPGLQVMSVDAFKQQVEELGEQFEFATLESALAFLKGTYSPSRNLCLLTFDDGLTDHYQQVTPILAERGIQGIFVLPTACVDEGIVLSAHKNHFLMAFLGFEEYRRLFLNVLKEHFPQADITVDVASAERTYRWDNSDVACFKFLINYSLKKEVSHRVLALLFEQVLGGEADFSKKLYLTWDQAREMQTRGMILGGHTHTHPILSACSPERQYQEIRTSLSLLKARLNPQELWPFAYPFGKRHTFTALTVELLNQVGYACAFTTEVGTSRDDGDIYAIHRLDPKDVRSLTCK